MKFAVGLAVLVSGLALVSAAPECGIATKLMNITGECTDIIKTQIQEEIDASYFYLEMATFFSQDIVNRPGLAKFFFDFARKKREYGSKLIEYLLMRGGLTNDVTNLFIASKERIKTGNEWSGVTALRDALQLETRLFMAAPTLISICYSDDSHFFEYLRDIYRLEIFEGRYEIFRKFNTLETMKEKHGELAECLFDKELL